MSSTHVSIASAGCFTPATQISNAELVQRFDLEVDADWIEERTGIRSRHWLEPDLATSDMATAAAERILDRAGVEARDVDRIVLNTITPDHPSPSTATIVARKLGARCPAFDLSAACAGFLYGLDLGAAAVRGGERNVLVISADTRSRFLNPADRRALVLFADGAAGVLLQPSENPGLLSIVLGAEGREDMGAYIPAGGSRKPTTAATVDAGEHYLQVDARNDIFDLFVRFTREACDAALAEARMSLDDIDLFITHQGNALLVQAAAEDLGIGGERVVNEIAEHGNTAGATVPIALTEALDSGRIRKGDRVLLTSVGAGYTFGAAVHQF